MPLSNLLAWILVSATPNFIIAFAQYWTRSHMFCLLFVISFLDAMSSVPVWRVLCCKHKHELASVQTKMSRLSTTLSYLTALCRSVSLLNFSRWTQLIQNRKCTSIWQTMKSLDILFFGHRWSVAACHLAWFAYQLWSCLVNDLFGCLVWSHFLANWWWWLCWCQLEAQRHFLCAWFRRLVTNSACCSCSDKSKVTCTNHVLLIPYWHCSDADFVLLFVSFWQIRVLSRTCFKQLSSLDV